MKTQTRTSLKRGNGQPEIGDNTAAAQISSNEYNWLEYFDAALSTLECFEGHFTNVTQSKKAKKKGCFEYIALDSKQFLREMHKARTILNVLEPDDDEGRFLDVGCGVGTKVILANQIFSHASGLEFDKAYHKIASSLAESGMAWGCEFIQSDAMKFDRYDEYNVIYLYRPMRDATKQTRLEKRIAKECCEDTLIVAHLCEFALSTYLITSI